MTRIYTKSQHMPTKRAHCSAEVRVWTMDANRVPSAGDPVCLCFRCDALLTTKTMTVDRILPGAHGGTYVKSNVRPACGSCNSKGGGLVRKLRRTAF
jgi:hypothetical protein